MLLPVEVIPKTATPRMPRSVPTVFIIEFRGGYWNQPAPVGRPVSPRAFVTNGSQTRRPPAVIPQAPSAFMRGKAISSAPIISGMK
jgi:hypothetical protein